MRFLVIGFRTYGYLGVKEMGSTPQRPLRVVGARPTTPATDPLAPLVAAAKAGDADALRTVIVSAAPAMLRAIRGVLGAAHPDLEDVAQDAAIGLSRGLVSFRSECTVLHFACRIAVLTALAARRNARARSLPHMEWVAPDEEPSEHRSPALLAAASLRRETLRSLCETLPESQSEALVMTCVLGLTVEEIAAATGVPANTVWSRLRLAKRALRERVHADPRMLEALEIDE